MSLNLNLPALDQLRACRSLLIAGMGGGYDVFAGLPIAFELQRRPNLAVHLASLSFANIAGLPSEQRLTGTLAGVTADTASDAPYFPERHLARWFRERLAEEVTVWCFHKTGVRPLLDNYRVLVEHLAVDGIVLVNGGGASLLRGDEASAGAMVEETISLAAVNQLEQVPLRIMAGLGLGAERDIDYAHVFENMAALARAEALLGVCSLAAPMSVYSLYANAVLYAHQQPYQPPSELDAAVISAVQGAYGDYHLLEATRGRELHISPLVALYWFFDLARVAQHNLMCARIALTDTYMDAYRIFVQAQSQIEARPPASSPLP